MWLRMQKRPRNVFNLEDFDEVNRRRRGREEEKSIQNLARAWRDFKAKKKKQTWDGCGCMHI